MTRPGVVYARMGDPMDKIVFHRRARWVAGFLAIAISCGGNDVSPPPKTVTLFVEMQGVETAGLTLNLFGPVTMSAVTDASGKATFAGLPYGAQYTVTPQSTGDLIFIPPALNYAGTYDQDGAFNVTPNVEPAVLQIAGDKESGIEGGTYAFSYAPDTTRGFSPPAPYPNTILYDGSSWSMSFNSRVTNVKTGQGAAMSGQIVFEGTPQAQTYTEVTAGLSSFAMLCWQENRPASTGNGLTGAFWSGHNFNITFDSLSPVATNEPTVFYYMAHGTMHMDCPADPGAAAGTVTLDMTF
jgi:hypothetical protein